MKTKCTVELLQKDLSQFDPNLPIKILLTNRDQTKFAFLSLVSLASAPIPNPGGKIQETCLLQTYVSDEYFNTPLSEGDNNENNKNH